MRNVAGSQNEGRIMAYVTGRYRNANDEFTSRPKFRQQDFVTDVTVYL